MDREDQDRLLFVMVSVYCALYTLPLPILCLIVTALLYTHITWLAATYSAIHVTHSFFVINKLGYLADTCR